MINKTHMQFFFNRVFANQTQEHIERSFAIMNPVLFQRCSNDSICKSINVISYLKRIKDRNHIVLSIKGETSLAKSDMQKFLKKFKLKEHI